jgi:hypothetical protein
MCMYMMYHRPDGDGWIGSDVSVVAGWTIPATSREWCVSIVIVFVCWKSRGPIPTPESSLDALAIHSERNASAVRLLLSSKYSLATCFFNVGLVILFLPSSITLKWFKSKLNHYYFWIWTLFIPAVLLKRYNDPMNLIVVVPTSVVSKGSFTIFRESKVPTRLLVFHPFLEVHMSSLMNLIISLHFTRPMNLITRTCVPCHVFSLFWQIYSINGPCRKNRLASENKVLPFSGTTKFQRDSISSISPPITGLRSEHMSGVVFRYWTDRFDNRSCRKNRLAVSHPANNGNHHNRHLDLHALAAAWSNPAGAFVSLFHLGSSPPWFGAL